MRNMCRSGSPLLPNAAHLPACLSAVPPPPSPSSPSSSAPLTLIPSHPSSRRYVSMSRSFQTLKQQHKTFIPVFIPKCQLHSPFLPSEDERGTRVASAPGVPETMSEGNIGSVCSVWNLFVCFLRVFPLPPLSLFLSLSLSLSFYYLFD